MSACGSLTENISAFIDSILKSHMGSLPSYIKDTTDFITKIRQLPQLSKDRFLVTLDVSSLYSNIPHSDGIEACKSFMDNGCKRKESIQCISKLIELVLTKNHFQFMSKSLAQLWGPVWHLLTVLCLWGNLRTSLILMLCNHCCGYYFWMTYS